MTGTVETNPASTGLRVTSIDVIPVTVPRVDTFLLQRGASDSVSPFTVVRLKTNEGVIGYGEGVTRTLGIHEVIRHHLLDVIVGADPFDIVGFHRRFDIVETLITERREHWNPIRSAVEMAMYDLQGKWLGQPLYQLLGGRQRDSIPMIKNIGIGTPAEAAEKATHLTQVGYRALKIRVGGGASADLARLAAVREVAPPDVLVRVDANEAWDAKTAIHELSRMSDYGLESVEQPCAHWDIHGAAQVVANTLVPVIADESIWTLGDATNLFRAEAADALHLYIGKCGGIRQVMNIATVAEGFGKAITLGERVPLGISEAAHCHVGVALARLDLPCALAYDLNESDLLTTPMRHVGGNLFPPTGAGLGVEVDTERLEFYARKN